MFSEYCVSKMCCCISLQGNTSGGVKKAKVESWERSVGTLGGKGVLGSLVVRKKPTAAVSKPSQATTSAPTSQTGNSNLYNFFYVLFS